MKYKVVIQILEGGDPVMDICLPFDRGLEKDEANKRAAEYSKCNRFDKYHPTYEIQVWMMEDMEES